MTIRNPTSECVWRRVLVYGLGASGTAASRLLLALGAGVVGVDSRAADDLDLSGLDDPKGGFVYRRDADLDGLPADVDAVVVSPGVPLDLPLLEQARERALPILAEVELAYHYLSGPVVAITGSNGKSTTTALAGAMLREAGREVSVCGNIGPPLSAEVDAATVLAERHDGEAASGRVYVVELSSFQLSTIDRFRPRAAAFLNLAPDHLDRHGDVAGYTAAKRRIFENQTPDDLAVVNADDPLSRESVTRARKRLFSLQGPVADGCWLERGDEEGDGRGGRVLEVDPEGGTTELFLASDSPLPGEHNVANAMAAALLARAMGASADDCRRALRSFRGLAHRTERVAEADGVTWYDDSKGTNPAATLGCLRGFPDGSVHLVLGGSDKGADFTELTETVAAKARRVYLIGETAPKIEAALTVSGSPVAPIVRAGTLDRAVAEAAEAARPGEVVLLSPACASFDQFDNFNHRGDEFQRLVKEWVRERPGPAETAEVANG
jgi:UDP-N-acetylmuramoylalanine--D-glutamate ligase